MKYALIGATGAVGKALAVELAAKGTPFRVVGRSDERLRRDFRKYEPLVDYKTADLNDGTGAAAAFADVETVLYTVGVPYTQFDLHPKLTKTALAAATAAGVRRFVHLSTVYPYGKPRTEKVDESHPREPDTFKGRMRKEQEDLVLAADNKSGMRTTILRPPDFYGPHAEYSYAKAMFDGALKNTSANVIGPIDTPHEFIFVPDLAKTMLALAETEGAYGQAWNIGGPGVISTRRFAEIVFAAAGKKPQLRVAGRTMMRLIGLFNPFLREVFEMHYLWTTPVILNDERLRRLLGNVHKTPYEEGISKTLDSMRAA